MSLFDTIINEVDERFGLGNKAGSLLAGLLSMMTNRENGGFAGFLGLFENAGLGDTVSSWVTSGDNAELSNEQVKSALGEERIAEIAGQANVDQTAATSALGYMIPNVVDRLTPDGVVPQESDLLSRIGGYLSGLGGAAALGGGLGAAGGAFDRIGTAVDDKVGGASATVRDGMETVGDSARNVGAKASTAFNRADDAIEGDSGSSILKWIIPLVILLLAIALGWMFCGKSNVMPTNLNTNSNVNRNASVTTNVGNTAKTVDSSFKIEAKDGKYVVSGVAPDQKTLDEIKATLDAEFGAGNVDYAGLKVDANAKPFGAGWWDNFAKMLPNLKGWKTGALAFVGSTITEASGLPQAAIDQLKSLFASWKMPMSLMGAESTAKQANEEALKELAAAGSVDEVVKALNLSIINFASGKSDIPADAKPIIDKAAEVLKKQPAGTNVEIGGHTDSDGNDDANLKLSQARADSVKKALVALGVSDAMLTAKGYGETTPVAANDTPDNKFKNRRIEYKTGSGQSTTATTNTNTAK